MMYTPDKKHRNHFDMENNIQDHQGGTDIDPALSDKRKLDTDCMIHHPPIASTDMEHSDWVLASGTDEDLVNKLMEENHTLKNQLDVVQDKLSEAVNANKQWYQHNKKTEHTIEELQDQVSQEKAKHEKTKNALDRVSHSGVNAMGVSGERESVDLVRKNVWLEDEARFLREQLNKVQGKLRKMEMKETAGEPDDWTCGRCTLLNPGDAGKCAACGNQAPEQFLFMSGTLECDGPMGYCY